MFHMFYSCLGWHIFLLWLDLLNIYEFIWMHTHINVYVLICKHMHTYTFPSTYFLAIKNSTYVQFFFSFSSCVGLKYVLNV